MSNPKKKAATKRKPGRPPKKKAAVASVLNDGYDPISEEEMEKQKDAKQPEPQEKQITEMTITVPMAEIPERSYVNRTVRLNLKRKDGIAMKSAMLALQERGARLENGRYVQTVADTIRWILEQLAGS